MRRLLVTVIVIVWVASSAAQQQFVFPLRANSVRFAVLGDSGTGDAAQYAVGKVMAEYRAKFPFTFVIMLGDNIYGSERPQDFTRKFEVPYKPLLDAKVEFFASLGNHDDQNQRFYKLFNMGGKRYYSFKKEASASSRSTATTWIRSRLTGSGRSWRPRARTGRSVFHHPLTRPECTARRSSCVR